MKRPENFWPLHVCEKSIANYSLKGKRSAIGMVEGNMESAERTHLGF